MRWGVKTSPDLSGSVNAQSCCTHCQANSDCTYWIREYTRSNTQNELSCQLFKYHGILDTEEPASKESFEISSAPYNGVPFAYYEAACKAGRRTEDPPLKFLKKTYQGVGEVRIYCYDPQNGLHEFTTLELTPAPSNPTGSPTPGPTSAPTLNPTQSPTIETCSADSGDLGGKDKKPLQSYAGYQNALLDAVDESLP